MNELLIDTTTGPVQGETKRGGRRWKGIPYAAPPVGDLRFALPRPVAPWSEPFQATGRFPICPQNSGGLEAAAGGGSAESSEADCLTLNVWSAQGTAGLAPVMFWIHGGAFTSGSGLIPWYDGTNLARRGVVVVTINYRLGPLGFLHLDDEEGSGNAGIADQIAALGWVRDNIAAFGGDPDNVTIFGESAGGMSVATLLGAPSAKGLFRRAIPQSGAASLVNSAGAATRTTDKIMAAAGVDDIAGLRALPVDKLLEASDGIGINFTGGASFGPVHDGVVLPELPLDAVRDGSAAGVDLLTGWNAEEMNLFTLLDPRLASVPRDTLSRIVEGRGGDDAVLAAYEAAAGDELVVRLLSDIMFRLPAIELLDAQGSHGSRYGYEFRFSSGAMGGAMGAAHAVEIPFMFDNLDRGGVGFLVGEIDDEMRSLATAMADAWVAFAKTGTPVADGLPAWPSYESGGRNTMILDRTSSVEADPGSELRQVWS